MQIRNLAALLAAISVAHAFNSRHVNLAKRQAAGDLGTNGTSSSTTSQVTTTTQAASSQQPPQQPSQSSQQQQQPPPPPPSSTTTSTVQQPPPANTPAQQGSSSTTSSAAASSTTSSSSSIILTGDATLSASGLPALASITSGMPAQPTIPLSSTFSPGATPPISGAPTLPTFTINPADWPPMDKPPPTNAPEVAEWMQELNGYNIPDIPTTDGTCLGSPQSAANAQQNGWWTCGHWTRDTDIVDCPDKLTWGVSFDDGPAMYTPNILQYLAQEKITATFFVVGSRVIQYPQTLIDEYMAGHEIAVHTWSHTSLTTQTTEEIVAEFGYSRKAIQAVTGVTPTRMRPPYGDIDDRVRAIALAMGLIPIIWTTPADGVDFDTNDWKIPGGDVSPVESYETFQSILGNASTLDTGFIVLEHDLFEQTVDLAIGYTIPSALSYKPPLKLEAIGQCQHTPATDLYRETNTNKTFPFPNNTDSTSISGGSASGSSAGGGSSDTPGGSNSNSNNLAVAVGPSLSYLVGLVMVLLTSALW